ncbi:hypothetical protein F4777DRAFT_589168 [Nemania sp. FL0916]|nr:hypothetical protein F4777DRAFT_589168 [Nemania sp. FL0916]
MANQRIDVHHHFVPPFYAQAIEEAGGDPSGWPLPAWGVETDLEFNDEERIAFTFLTITAPGASILPPGEPQTSFCRKANEYAASVCSAHPERYGFFATIPSLQDVHAAEREIVYALDNLKADGIILYTRYGQENDYLGHPDFAAIWDLLESRHAVVFVHPTHPVDTTLVNPQLPQPMIDYPHETTRAAVDLITSGTIHSHPNVKIILSHAGGTLPYLAQRPASLLPYIPPTTPSYATATGHDTLSPETITAKFLQDARTFYFDTALSAAPLQLNLLKDFAKPGHILFGSDFPYTPTPAIKEMNSLLDTHLSNDLPLAHSINLDAALALFPRLADFLGK